jgi:hypothetical protein
MRQMPAKRVSKRGGLHELHNNKTATIKDPSPTAANDPPTSDAPPVKEAAVVAEYTALVVDVAEAPTVLVVVTGIPLLRL